MRTLMMVRRIPFSILILSALLCVSALVAAAAYTYAASAGDDSAPPAMYTVTFAHPSP